jgi:hypothetical protein
LSNTIPLGEIMNFKKLSFLAFPFAGLFSLAAANTPYEEIRSTNLEELRAHPAAFAQCIQMMTPGDIDLTQPLSDSVQIWGDCKNTLPSPILVNQAGYLPSDPFKEFLYVGNADGFQVINSSGELVSEGALALTGDSISTTTFDIRTSNWAGGVGGPDVRYTMSGSGAGGSVRKGSIPSGLSAGEKYRIQVGNDISQPFIIQEDVYTQVRAALLKFFGANRSGDSESWFHGPSNTQDATPGGWYDCGDFLKEGITQSYALAMLGLTAAVHSETDADLYSYNHNDVIPDGVGDILREARHGADYVLHSYRAANGVVADMITSIGDFGSDHISWTRPEENEALPENYGGAPREARNEVGANIMGRFAAGLAFTGKLYENIDAEFSAEALQIARELYDFAIENREDVTMTPAYSVEHAEDDLLLAAIALLWATEESNYKFDLVENTDLGNGQAGVERGAWTAGLMATRDNAPLHWNANTGWARTEVPAIWAFYKLLLSSPERAEQFGFSEEERLTYSEDLLYDMVANLSYNSYYGENTIELPAPGILWTVSPQLGTDFWGWMETEQEWVANRYQWGNITDVFVYWDLAKDLNTMDFPDAGVQDWKVNDVHKILMRQLNYMLGVNPYDMSFILGVGDKHPMHPHHRAANPEGWNGSAIDSSLVQYGHSILTGAVWGGSTPENGYDEYWDNYYETEVCIDGAANALIPLSGLSIYAESSSASKEYKSASNTFTWNTYNGTVSVYSSNGRLTSTKEWNNGADNIEHLKSDLSSGMYWLKAENGQQRSLLVQ